MSVLHVRERGTVKDESRIIGQVYFYLRTTDEYSSNVSMCKQYVCECVSEREVIIPVSNVIHRNRLISLGTRGNTASVLEELCLYEGRRRGFLKIESRHSKTYEGLYTHTSPFVAKA